MAQRSTPSRGTGSGSSSRKGSGSTQVRRAKAAPVKKPFPWGFAAGAAVLAVLLIGVLVYAVSHAGSAAPSPLRDADKSIKGLQVVDGKLSQTHKQGPLTFAQSPPVGGAHNPVWETCKVYDAQIPKEHAVHSLEHGGVWVTYQPGLAADQVKVLKDLVGSDPYRMLSPYPGLKTPVSIQAWGRQLFVDSAKDARLSTFADAFTNGPQTPEKGSACAGGVTATGTAPVSAGAGG